MFSSVLEIWRYACSIATQEFDKNDLGIIGSGCTSRN
jgi:hypothetical protein